jgi:hypothetical protein
MGKDIPDLFDMPAVHDCLWQRPEAGGQQHADQSSPGSAEHRLFAGGPVADAQMQTLTYFGKPGPSLLCRWLLPMISV